MKVEKLLCDCTPKEEQADNMLSFVGLNGSALFLVAGGQLGRVTFEINGMRPDGLSYNRDPWVMYLYALNELITYF